jgi:hypothetical protein
MFVSLNVEPATHQAAIDAVSAELEAPGVPVKDGRWSYRLLVVDDLDHNQLFSMIRTNRRTKEARRQRVGGCT